MNRKANNRGIFSKDHFSRWSAYAAASGTTLAMSTNADAGIIYSGVQDLTATIPANGTDTSHKPFSVNGIIENIIVANNSGGIRAGEVGLSFPGVVSTKPHFSFGAATGAPLMYLNGEPIHPAAGSFFTTDALETSPTLWGHNGNGSSGPLKPGNKSGILGFKTTLNGDLGWVRVSVSDTTSDGYPDAAEIIDWAYNNTPGGAINAGQTTDTPEPGTAALGLLASGAAGLLVWRNRRAELGK